MAKQTEAKRGPGRPASFSVPTVQFLSTIPTETRQLVRNLAEAREENINVTLDALIRRGAKEMGRKRS